MYELVVLAALQLAQCRSGCSVPVSFYYPSSVRLPSTEMASGERQIDYLPLAGVAIGWETPKCDFNWLAWDELRTRSVLWRNSPLMSNCSFAIDVVSRRGRYNIFERSRSAPIRWRINRR